jgi:hypothetical protein
MSDICFVCKELLPVAAFCSMLLDILLDTI